MQKYRRKIYQHYSSNRIGRLSPDTVEGFKPREPYFKKIIKEHFPKNKNVKILEIGCGHGAFIYYIQRAGYTDIAGIDDSDEQVQEAHRLGIKNVQQADLEEYFKGIKDNSLDVLIAIDVIEHFTKEEGSDLVDEFYRVLKKGGIIISHQPNSEGPFGNFMRDWDFTHETGFTRQSVAQLFLSSGFSSIQSYEDKPVVHGVKSLVRFVLWEYLIRQIYNFITLVETGAKDRSAIYSRNFLSVVIK